MDFSNKRIGLLDHMGWGNMGDAAIQEAVIANIKRRIPNACLIGFSLYPEDTKRRHGIESYSIRWWHPGMKGQNAETAESAAAPKHSIKDILRSHKAIHSLAKRAQYIVMECAHLVRSYRVVRSLDMLIISGGGQLCELHGDLPYNVFKFCLLGKLASKPVLMLGVGADLLKRPINRFLAKWAVRLTNYASFRSEESRILVRSLGVRKPLHVCPDPAYALDVCRHMTLDERGALTRQESENLLGSLGFEAKPDGGPSAFAGREEKSGPYAAGTAARRPKVGLNPMGYCDPRRWPKKDAGAYRQYLDKLATFSTWLLRQGFDLELFTSDILTDVLAMEDLKGRLSATLGPEEMKRIEVRALPTLNELLVQMSAFQFVITSKFHGVIFSHLLAKPVIALSYLPKIEDLMRAVGHVQYCMDIACFQTDQLMEKFALLVKEEDSLRKLFEGTTASYSGILRDNFDHLFGRESESAALVGAADALAVAE